MAPFHFPTHSNKLWFHVYNEIAVISAKFSVNLINSITVTSCKTMDRCLALSDALTTTQASIAWLTSFLYDVILHWRPFHARNGLSFAYFWRVLGEFDPLYVVSYRADPKRHFLAWLRVIWTIVRENPPTDHFSRRVREKINQIRPYISRICQDAPLRSIGTNFGLRARLVDLINCAKFYRNRLRGLDTVRGRSLTIPIGLRCRR